MGAMLAQCAIFSVRAPCDFIIPGNTAHSGQCVDLTLSPEKTEKKKRKQRTENILSMYVYMYVLRWCRRGIEIVISHHEPYEKLRQLSLS